MLGEDGKLFGDLFTRDWTRSDEDQVQRLEDQPQCFKDYLYFIDKYAVRVVGPREVAKFHRENQDKNVFDKVKSSDVAYAILMYESTIEVWEDQVAGGDTEKGQKYHRRKGSKLETYTNAWTEEGLAYLKELNRKVGVLRRNANFMELLLKCWKEYVQKNKCKYALYEKTKRGKSYDDGDDGEVMSDKDIELELPGDISDTNFEGMPFPDRGGGEASGEDEAPREDEVPQVGV
jgi:hypothetical protein